MVTRSRQVGMRVLTLLLPLLLILTASSTLRATVPEREKQKIEALIHAVEILSGASFIRNGKSYNSAAAAKFLRGKWRAHENEIITAVDFIEKIASVSSTSEKVYLIRFPDGHEVPSARFFQEKLSEINEKR